MGSSFMNNLNKNLSDHPEYISIDIDGPGEYALLCISIDLFKINSEFNWVIWEKGSYYLERNEVVDRFVKEVLRYCEDLKNGEEEFDRLIRTVKADMKAFAKKKGYITSSFACKILHYKQRKSYNERMRKGLLAALEKDKPFLDALKS